MPTLIKCKIDIAKVHGAKVLKKDRRTFVEVTACKLFEGKNGALYVDFAMFPTSDDKFGNDWRITQDLPKELRNKGEKGPILGNAKNKDFGGGGGASAPRSQAPVNDDQDPPF